MIFNTTYGNAPGWPILIINFYLINTCAHITLLNIQLLFCGPQLITTMCLKSYDKNLKFKVNSHNLTVIICWLIYIMHVGKVPVPLIQISLVHNGFKFLWFHFRPPIYTMLNYILNCVDIVRHNRKKWTESYRKMKGFSSRSSKLEPMDHMYLLTSNTRQLCPQHLKSQEPRKRGRRFLDNLNVVIPSNCRKKRWLSWHQPSLNWQFFGYRDKRSFHRTPNLQSTDSEMHLLPYSPSSSCSILTYDSKWSALHEVSNAICIHAMVVTILSSWRDLLPGTAPRASQMRARRSTRRPTGVKAKDR